MLVPIALAAVSPYLQGRGIAYIVAGFAGVACLALFLIQPLLAAGYVPGLHPSVARRLHRAIGGVIAVGVLLHVGGLYITSPPDALDALLLVSPTPFSVYGVIALWGMMLTVLIVALRRRLRLRPVVWNTIHNGLALVVVIATIVHALQIEGTMEPVSKWVLSGAVLVVTTATIAYLRMIKPLLRRR